VTAPSTEDRFDSSSAEAAGRAHAPGIQWVFPLPGGEVTLTPLDRPHVVLGREGDGPSGGTGREVSRRHAEIRREGDVLVLSDAGSSNGTFVNGERIKDRRLRARDVVRLGEWIGVVIDDAGEAAAGGFEALAPGLFAGPDLAAALAPLRTAAADARLPVVLEGETGTGKERVARAIHLWSGRPGPFVAVNAAAIPESIAEAELFGHRKGAFSGAERAGTGYFRAAAGGTLLIDEIVDLPAGVQAKLLRCLENREVVPLGETTPVPIDVRVVAAAQIPLAEALREQRLRPDLVARLDGVTVRLPPLRERIREVPFLFVRMLEAHLAAASLPLPLPDICPRLMERLCLHDWPFNVRELERLAGKLAVLHGHEPRLRRAHLPAHLRASAAGDGEPRLPAAGDGGEAAPTLASLAASLRLFRGNVARAAAAMGISRQRAYRLMEAGGDLDPAAFRSPPGRSNGNHPPE
jgi:transcriptional regulator with AAA-type ATPase domain